MATVDLGYNLSIDLESGEEILFKCINDPNNAGWKKDDDSSMLIVQPAYYKHDNIGHFLLSMFTLGFAGPRMVFNSQLIITNKRMVLIPFPNSKRTKTENYTTQTFCFKKDIKGAEADKREDNTYAECINTRIKIIPMKGVDLKDLHLLLNLNLSKEEMTAVSKSMQEQAANQQRVRRVEELASQIAHDNFFDAFTTQARVEMWKSNVKKMNKISVLGDKSILPIRDYLVWLINNTAAGAK